MNGHWKGDRGVGAGILPKDFKEAYYWKHESRNKMDIKEKKNLIEMHFYLTSIPDGPPATVYSEFLVSLVDNLVSLQDKEGFIRVFVHEGDEDNPISYLMRCFNGYVNGFHNGFDLYELSFSLLLRPRYFLHTYFTDYTEEYHTLLDRPRSRGNLLHLEIGPNMLRQDVSSVRKHPLDPKQWMEPIARFSLTFSEPSRLVWVKEDMVDAFQRGIDIRIEGRYAYISEITRLWGAICARAENRHDRKLLHIEDTTSSDPFPQPPRQLRTPYGIKKLLSNSKYAAAAVQFRTIRRNPRGEGSSSSGGGGGGGLWSTLSDVGHGIVGGVGWPSLGCGGGQPSSSSSSSGGGGGGPRSSSGCVPFTGGEGKGKGKGKETSGGGRPASSSGGWPASSSSGGGRDIGGGTWRASGGGRPGSGCVPFTGGGGKGKWKEKENVWAPKKK